MVEITPIKNRPGLSLVTSEMIDKAHGLLMANPERISITFIQRNLRIGYNQAARIIEHFEHHGVVSPMSKSGTRTLLTPNA